jgi:hypothetical protein
MNRKMRVHVPSVKPLKTPHLDRINPVIIEKQTLFTLVELNPIPSRGELLSLRGCGFKRKKYRNKEIEGIISRKVS